MQMKILSERIGRKVIVKAAIMNRAEAENCAFKTGT